MTLLDPTNPEAYRKAAELIETGGLAKWTYHDDNGSRCVVGALMDATKADTNRYVFGHAQYLADLLGVGPWWNVMNWNDQRERTAADVIGLLTTAAEKLEANR